MPMVAVVGRLAASGYCFPPFSGMQTSFPSKTVMGQKLSSDDFLSPTVSKKGDHSQEICSVWLLPSSSTDEPVGIEVATKIEIMPSESIAIREQSLLKPAQEREEPVEMQHTGPLQIVFEPTAS